MSVGGFCKQNTAFIKERKREEVAVGPGPRECKAGYETNNCGELRVRCRGLRALEGNGQGMSVGGAGVGWVGAGVCVCASGCPVHHFYSCALQLYSLHREVHIETCFMPIYLQKKCT